MDNNIEKEVEKEKKKYISWGQLKNADNIKFNIQLTIKKMYLETDKMGIIKYSNAEIISHILEKYNVKISKSYFYIIIKDKEFGDGKSSLEELRQSAFARAVDVSTEELIYALNQDAKNLTLMVNNLSIACYNQLLKRINDGILSEVALCNMTKLFIEFRSQINGLAREGNRKLNDIPNGINNDIDDDIDQIKEDMIHAGITEAEILQIEQRLHEITNANVTEIN